MYKCDNPKCKGIFEDPGSYKEYHNEIEGGFYELLPCCPYCGCEDYSEIEDPEEDNEIEDDENEIESVLYLIVVRYNSLQGYYKNAYFYASNKKEADAIVDKYTNGEKTRLRTKLCRIYKLVDEKEGTDVNP